MRRRTSSGLIGWSSSRTVQASGRAVVPVAGTMQIGESGRGGAADDQAVVVEIQDLGHGAQKRVRAAAVGRAPAEECAASLDVMERRDRARSTD